MRNRFSGKTAHIVVRGAAVLLAGGLAAGCSSDATRFKDSFYTSSVPQSSPQAASQPYPGDVDSTFTGSVNRGGYTSSAEAIPGGRVVPDGSVGQGATAYSAPQQTYQQYPQAPRAAVTPAPIERRAMDAPSVDTTVTGSTTRTRPVDIVPARTSAPVARKPAAVDNGNHDGWTKTGGTTITLREGETIYNLSKRFGVPAKAIMKVNGITNPRDVASGQKIVIPTYVYSSKAPVSMPDANPRTASAKSSRGVIANDREDNPVKRQDDKAVLPKTAQTREKPVQSASANRDSAARKAASNSAYSVRSGDSLYAIAKRNGVTVTALKQANGLKDGTIRVGQKLVIPNGGGSAPATVASAKKATPPGVDPIVTGAAGPSKPAEKRKLREYTPPASGDKVAKATTGGSEKAPDATGIGKMRWPVRGKVIAGFGSASGGKVNDGIDIAVPMGTPVKAAENGVVIYAGDGLKEFGNTVLLRHEDGLVTVYGHASELKVSRGQTVRRGQEIARAGATGSAETPKVHFEVRKNSSPVNPGGYLE